MTNAATRFQPDISGSAVPTGFVGEMFGTQRNGTGGFSYSDQSTTASGGSATTVLSRTLDKGFYFVSFATVLGNTSSIATLYRAGIAIGGTFVAGTASASSNFQTTVSPTGANACYLSACVPIIISANSTVLTLQVAQPGQNATPSNTHEWWIYRIG